MVCQVAVLGLHLEPLTYSVSKELASLVQLGSLVSVQVKEKIYYGVVTNLSSEKESELKPIIDCLIKDFLPTNLLQLMEFVARYYFVPLSAVLNLALPQKLIPFLLKQNKEMVLPPFIKNEESSFAAFLHWGYVTKENFKSLFLSQKEALEQKKSILLLFPEIAVLKEHYQYIKECAPISKEVMLACYHSKVGSKIQCKVWQELRGGQSAIILGVRSAVFLPFLNLGKIFVFYEHSPYYKERERRVHFNAKDTAYFRAYLEKIPIHFATPTPSLEAFYRALNKEFKVCPCPQPKKVIKVIIAKRKEKKEGLSKTLKNFLYYFKPPKEDCFLLIPQKGYARIAICEDCGYWPKCPNCDVSLFYYRLKPSFLCHYCGYETIFETCPGCLGENFDYLSFGCERVIEEIKADRKLAGKISFIKMGFSKELGMLKENSLSFAAILNLERLLSLPNLRAVERVYQIVEELKTKIRPSGFLIIQSLSKKEPMLNFLKENKSKQFYHWLLKKRAELSYPPFGHLLVFKLMGEKELVLNFRDLLKTHLEKNLGKERSDKLAVLGPIKTLKRKRGKIIYHLILKIQKEIRIHDYLSYSDLKSLVPKKLNWEVDFDPIDI